MNSRKLIDISLTLTAELPTWPGSHGLHLERLQEIGPESDANVSRLDMDVHTGTHIDAPLHFVANAEDTSSIPLSTLVGPCRVISIPNTVLITRAMLQRWVGANVPQRILFQTDNSSLRWDDTPFNKAFTALSADAAEWLVDRGVLLVGIDYLSVQRFSDPSATHQILLKNRVVILEGIYLGHVSPGNYQLICLPLKVKGVEGVPCRAVLQKTQRQSI